MKPGFGYARRNIPKVSNSTVCLVFLLLLVASYWFLAPDAVQMNLQSLSRLF